ncbi:MAG: 50S ribosomal protein L10 [Lachnospiraceae bacterium]|nr:50S ribosomal protein L10 [Lachnospiraceae bacterium]
MAKVELKQPIVAEIKENVKDAASVVLVDHRGLTVAQDTQLRKTMRENDVIYKVYKNTMIKLALDGTGFEELDKDLEGPTAIVVSKTDATAPARLVQNFAKTAPALEIKSGIVEGNYYDQAGIKQIALVPSREELLSKLLGSIQSPIANFARVIKQIAEKLEANGGASAADVVAPAEAAAPAEEAAAEVPADAAPAEA